MAVLTASGSLPSTLTPGKPYPSARRARGSTRAISPIGVFSLQPLFSQTNTTGRERAAAVTKPSWTAPWLVAPSPNETTVTRPDRGTSSSAASATPHAIGTPAPTIEFSPKKAVLGRREIRRAAAPAIGAGLPSENLCEQRLERNAAGDRPAMPAVGREHTVVVAQGLQRPDRDCLLPA